MRTLFERWPPGYSGQSRAISSRNACKAANIATFGFTDIRPITSAMTDKDYVVRPWTEEENADFERFCASIDVTPSDPAHVQAMEDGPVDFFNNDPWFDMELPRA